MAKGLAVGLNKGHVVNKIEVPSWTKSTAPRKRVKLIRKVVSEICGHSAFEKKLIELLKQSKGNKLKKVYKLAKKSLGTHKRALRKRNELQEIVSHHH